MPGTRICCFHSPKPSKCSKCKLSFLVLLFRSSKRGTSTWRIQDLPHFPFGICTHIHTGAYRDRQSGGTALALAELGASECPLFSTCFTPPKGISLLYMTCASTFAADGCVCRGWPMYAWFTTTVSSRFATQHWHYTRICSKCLPSELHLIHNFDMHCAVICNPFWVLRAVGWIWHGALCKIQFVCTGS